MSNYAIGGWSQKLHAQTPSTFTYSMFGMVTNLAGLTSGTPQSPGWSPAREPAPTTPGKTLWTYGGGGATPDNMPATQSDIDAIVNACNNQNWDGVDFDDESSMNIEHLVTTMRQLNAKEKSYTFLAGWAFNNPGHSALGKNINDSVQHIANEGICDRFNLMCYAAAMWNMNDIDANVGPAIERTINYVGDAKKVYLALTPAGLNAENLNYFLDQVTSHNIGGLMVWDYPHLNADDLNTIETKLGINMAV